MFGKPPKIERIKLDAEMNRVLDQMDHTDPNSEEYSELMSHLERLSKLRTHERPQRVSRDTLVTAGAGLLSVLVIVGYEFGHAVTTKAFGVMPKVRNS